MSLKAKNDTGKKLVNKKMPSSGTRSNPGREASLGESLPVQNNNSPRKDNPQSYQKNYDNSMSTATEALQTANDTIFRPEVVNGPYFGKQPQENEYAKQPGGPPHWKTSPGIPNALGNDTLNDTQNYLNGHVDEAVFFAQQQQYHQQQNYGNGDPNIVAPHLAQPSFYGYPPAGFEAAQYATEFHSQPATFTQNSGIIQPLALRSGAVPKEQMVAMHTQPKKKTDGNNTGGQILPPTMAHDLEAERQMQHQRTWANSNPQYAPGFPNAFFGHQQAAIQQAAIQQQQRQQYHHGQQYQQQYPQYQQQFSHQNVEQHVGFAANHADHAVSSLEAGSYQMQPYVSHQGFPNQAWGYAGPDMSQDAHSVLQFLSNVEMTKQMAIEIASLKHEMGNLKIENENLKNTVPNIAVKKESAEPKFDNSGLPVEERLNGNVSIGHVEQSENFSSDQRSVPTDVQINSGTQSNLSKKTKNQKVVRISNDIKRPGLLGTPATSTDQNVAEKTEKSKIKTLVHEATCGTSGALFEPTLDAKRPWANSKKNMSKNAKKYGSDKQKKVGTLKENVLTIDTKQESQNNNDDMLRKDSTEIAKLVKRSYKDAAMNSTSSLERSESDISIGIENMKQSQGSPRTKEDVDGNVSSNQSPDFEDENSSDMSNGGDSSGSQNTSEKEKHQTDKSSRGGDVKETTDGENDDFVVADLPANDSTGIPFGKTTKIRIQTQKGDATKQLKQLQQESQVQQDMQSDPIPIVNNPPRTIKGYGKHSQPYLLYYDGKSSNCRTTFHKIEGTNVYDVRIKIDGSHVNAEKKFVMKTELNVCMPPGVHLLVDKPDETDDNKDLLFVKGHISSTSNGFLHITMKNKTDQKVELKAGMSIAKISFVADIECIEAKLSSKVHQKIKENRTETNSQQYFSMIDNYINNNAKKVKYVDIGASGTFGPLDSDESNETEQTKFQHFIGNDFVKEIDKIYSLADIISKKSNSNNKNKKANGKYSQVVPYTDNNSSTENTNQFHPYKKESRFEKKQQKSNTKIVKREK